MIRYFLAATTAAAALALGGASALAKPGHALPSHAHAVAALERAKDLLAGRGVRTGRELSPALTRLAASLPALSGSDRQQAVLLLARPDDSQTDPDGTHKYDVPPILIDRYCTAHFCIHWVSKPGDRDAPSLTDTSPADGTPDYVEQMANVFENEVFPCENGEGPTACSLVADAGGQVTGSTPGLAWAPPASDGTLGGDDRLDVYIQDLFPDGIFGYVAPDSGQTRDPSVPHYAYMVMDKDFSRFAKGSAAGGLAEERVTAAHEYNHVLQNGYDFLEDLWMFESTAVWMEDKVYPQINDYLQYVGDWAANTGQPLTTFTRANLKPYGSAVWNHWLDHRYGPAAVRSAWESSVASGDFAPGAYLAAVIGAGGVGFFDEFDRFAAAVAEWDAPGSAFPDPYPDVARAGSLPVGNATAPFTLPHTTFALFDVPIPDTSVPAIRLTATLPSGVSGALALVGRTGPGTSAGSVTSNLTPLPSGGTGAVTLDAPAGYGRITAVVVNSDFTRSGSDPASGDWIFAHDDAQATAQLDAPGPPAVVTGIAATISDHAATVMGSVDPHLLDTTWSIEYGPTAAYGNQTEPQPVAGTNVTPAQVAAALSGLDPLTTYHYRLVAGNSAGSAVGADMTFNTAADVTPPTLVLSVKKREKLKTVRARGLVFGASADERCAGTAQIELPKRVATKLHLPRVLGKAKLALAPGVKAKTIRIRLGRTALKRLARLRRSLKVTLVVSVADASHNRRVEQRRVTFRR